MIVRPMQALLDAHDVEAVATVMADICHDYKPDMGVREWSIWAVKYKSIGVVKKCAVATYMRYKEGR
jgi:hypothetical protein